MSAVPLSSEHSDYDVLAPLVEAILRQSEGYDVFEEKVPELMRKAIDEVIDAPRTNRFTLDETEKTEKTYLGTKIEILFRAFLGLPKGKVLDLSIDGIEVDIKNTMRTSWEIPREAFNRPCILLRENEASATCSVGIIVANPDYFTAGENNDKKKKFSAEGLLNAWWILRHHPYPANIWQTMPPARRAAIMSAGGGTRRLAVLFEEIQMQPIQRTTVEAIGQQKDPLRRIRRDRRPGQTSGARDILAPKGIAILWGQKDRNIIDACGLGRVRPDEFISYKPTDPVHINLLRKANHID